MVTVVLVRTVMTIVISLCHACFGSVDMPTHQAVGISNSLNIDFDIST